MKEVSSLATELKAHLPWHQARMVFLAQFMLSLLRSRSCDFYRVAEAFQSMAIVSLFDNLGDGHAFFMYL